MRWKPKPPKKQGTERTYSTFLVFPKYLDGEWRWLEPAVIKQFWNKYKDFDEIGPIAGWSDETWND